VEIPQEWTILLNTIQQQAQSAQTNCENLRGYTQAQLDQVRALITQTQEQNRALVEQAIERLRMQAQKDWDAMQRQWGGEIQRVNEDIHELKTLLQQLQDKDLKEIRDMIATGNKENQEKQTESYKRIIATQGAILFFLFTTAVGIIVKLVWH
jgi:hypothetical protein